MTLEQLARQGRRTESMTTAATISSKMSQIRKESIKQAFSDFENVRHRYEFVKNVEGVSYFDDSAACSVEASWFTFDNLGLPVIWITYGNNIDCDDLIPQVRKYVKYVICIGNDNRNFHKVYDDILKNNIIDCESIGDAVAMAAKISVYGDNVLFSPACHNKSEFVNYAEKGDYFQQCVGSINK